MLGKICTQLISFLLLPIYTAVLPAGDYGFIDLVTTYSALAIPLLGFQLEMGVFRYLIDNRKNEKNKSILITNTFFTILGSTIAFSTIFIVFANIFDLPHLWLILSSTVAMLFSGFFLQVARGLGDNAGYSIGSVITGISTIIINLLLVLVLHWGIDGVLLATTVANALCIIFLVIRESIPHYLKFRTYNKNEISKVVKYSAPLIPNSIIWWIINVSDRTIISIFMNMAANGIYAVSNRFSSIISAVYGVFNLSWTESASLHINDLDKDDFFSRTFNSTIKIFSSISLLMLAFTSIAFKVMIGDGYYEAYLYIPILTIGMIFNVIVSFIGAIYIAKKKTKEVAMTSFWSGVLNIGINLALIKMIGVWAAALSTLLAFLIMSVYRYFDVQKYVKLQLNIKEMLILIGLFAFVLIFYYINTPLAIVANVTISLLSGVTINKGILKTIATTIKGKILS